MGRRANPIPKLTEKDGYARCWANGKYHHFGDAGTPEAERAYREFVAQYAINPNVSPQSCDLTVLFGDFLSSSDGPTTKEGKNRYRMLAKRLGELGLRPAYQVSAEDVKLWARSLSQEKKPDGLTAKFTRDSILRMLANLKKVYKHAVTTKKLTRDQADPILLIETLPINEARKKQRRMPVPRADVEATLAFLTPTVAAMVRLQLMTGMRPSELFLMKPDEVYTTGVVVAGGMARDLDKLGLWAYIPDEHKTAHHGHSWAILLNAKCQELLRPRLGRDKDDYLFKPVESVAESKRITDLDFKRSRVGARQYNTRYTRQSYAQSVERAAKKANVPHWTPYQIRHLVAQELQLNYGLEYARAVLRQKTISVTANYAGWDFKRAEEVAKNEKGTLGPLPPS